MVYTTGPFNGSRDPNDIRTFYTSELDYLVAMRTRFACPNCGTATGTCVSCEAMDKRIKELNTFVLEGEFKRDVMNDNGIDGERVRSWLGSMYSRVKNGDLVRLTFEIL